MRCDKVNASDLAQQTTMSAIKGIGVWALVLLALALVAPMAAQAKLDQEGCRYPVSVDYAAPLRQMAPIHRPPQTGQNVPFAPRGVTVRVPVPTVQAGAGDVGLELTHGSKSSVWLNWTVVSHLSRVKASGAVTKVLRTKIQRVIRLRAGQPELSTFQFAVSGRPAFYKVDSTFFDASGRHLGEYAEYFRVLKRRSGLRESVFPRMAHGGDVLVTRTENIGTTPIGLGNDYVVERFEEGKWTLDPVTPKGFAGISIVLFGGVTYECHSLSLPRDMAPGHYRYRKEIEGSPAGRAKRDISADFFVVP